MEVVFIILHYPLYECKTKSGQIESLAIINESEEFKMALANRIIVIDAGHGGKFDGVTFDHWLYGPIKEKDVNLRVAKKLKEKLLAENVVVKMLGKLILILEE